MGLLQRTNLYVIYMKHTIISLFVSLYGKVLGSVFSTLVCFFMIDFGLPFASLCWIMHESFSQWMLRGVGGDVFEFCTVACLVLSRTLLWLVVLAEWELLLPLISLPLSQGLWYVGWWEEDTSGMVHFSLEADGTGCFIVCWCVCFSLVGAKWGRMFLFIF